MGADTDAERRPVSHPSSSNRTCPFSGIRLSDWLNPNTVHLRAMGVGQTIVLCRLVYQAKPG